MNDCVVSGEVAARASLYGNGGDGHKAVSHADGFGTE